MMLIRKISCFFLSFSTAVLYFSCYLNLKVLAQSSEIQYSEPNQQVPNDSVALVALQFSQSTSSSSFDQDQDIFIADLIRNMDFIGVDNLTKNLEEIKNTEDYLAGSTSPLGDTELVIDRLLDLFKRPSLPVGSH